MNMKKFVTLSLMMLAGATVLMLAVARQAAPKEATCTFNLIGPQTTKDDGTGNTIRMTGTGSFETPAGPVVASGAFAIFDSSGSEISAGTWKATAFGSFEPFGGKTPGEQGGVLHITVTLFPAGAGPVTDVSMTVTCLINEPAGFLGTEAVTVTGTVGDFTDVVRGATLFHLNG
jgi:hypothetical protein